MTFYSFLEYIDSVPQTSLYPHTTLSDDLVLIEWLCVSRSEEAIIKQNTFFVLASWEIPTVVFLRVIYISLQLYLAWTNSSVSLVLS